MHIDCTLSSNNLQNQEYQLIYDLFWFVFLFFKNHIIWKAKGNHANYPTLLWKPNTILVSYELIKLSLQSVYTTSKNTSHLNYLLDCSTMMTHYKLIPIISEISQVVLFNWLPFISVSVKNWGSSLPFTPSTIPKHGNCAFVLYMNETWSRLWHDSVNRWRTEAQVK